MYLRKLIIYQRFLKSKYDIHQNQWGSNLKVYMPFAFCRRSLLTCSSDNVNNSTYFQILMVFLFNKTELCLTD